VELADDSFSHLGKTLKKRLKGLVLGGSLSFSKKKLASNYRVISDPDQWSSKIKELAKELTLNCWFFKFFKKPQN
jgi:hypothetical protein